MASAPDPKLFGAAIAEMRRSKGLRQRDIADRISTYYSEESSYRRIERGQRLPDRDAAIAILFTGLEVTEIGKINELLALARYAPLTEKETLKLQIAPSQLSPAPTTSGTAAPLTSWSTLIVRANIHPKAVCLILGSVILAVLIAAGTEHAAMLIATAVLYASLYVSSVVHESLMDPQHPPLWPVVSSVFCLMLVSSVFALALDRWLAPTGNPMALALSFGIFFGAAAAQWVIARTVLSESAVVPLGFQAHTAQAAHLKNTLYFLVIVVMFWLPPFHCVAALAREIRSGHAAWARTISSRHFIFGPDFAALSPETSWFVFLVLALLAVAMAVRLLENLKFHPKLNAFTALLYLRAGLYFLLVLVCLIWYSSQVGSLPLG